MLTLFIFLAVTLIAILLVCRLCEHLDWSGFFLCFVGVVFTCAVGWFLFTGEPIEPPEPRTTRVAVYDASGGVIAEYVGRFRVEWGLHPQTLFLEHDDGTITAILYSSGTVLVERNFEEP